MTEKTHVRKKLLVAIASYGSSHESYLLRLIQEYRSLPFETRIVVLSNIPKDLGPEVEVAVGMPTENPWSLPFGHKKIFADHLDQYDLFIYSEDDILITERNIQSFLRACEVLAEDEVAGFFIQEARPDGEINYVQAHGHFRWVPESVCSRGEHTFAIFTNEHSACYILTQQQLRRAIASGGFLVPPHQGRHDMLCSAATDPYTQCGFKKLICISHLNEFLVQHLPNRYFGKFGVSDVILGSQIRELLKRAGNGHKPVELFHPETKFPGALYSKDLYEPVREDIVSLIPPGARSVLSLGYGRGATEVFLARKGLKVVAVPVDPVISAGLEAEGIEFVNGDFNGARQQLAGVQFDCLLVLNLLHLVRNPAAILESWTELLSPFGCVIVAAPNFQYLKVLWRRIRGESGYKNLANYDQSGVYATDRKNIQKWLRDCGFAIDEMIEIFPSRWPLLQRFLPGIGRTYLTIEMAVRARRV